MAGFTFQVQAATGSVYYFNQNPSAAFSFGATGSTNDVISQTISVTAGCTYAVSYYLSRSNTAGSDFFPAVDGVVLRGSNGLSLEVKPGDPCLDNGSASQVFYRGYFTATSSTAVLSFGGRNPPSYTDLQDIHVLLA